MGVVDRIARKAGTAVRRWVLKDYQVFADDGFIAADAAQRWSRYGQLPDDFLASNVIMSPVNWILRNFTEAEAVVERRQTHGWQSDPDHELSRLLAQPNPFYGDNLLWKATVLSLCFDGNGYWQKIRNRFGDVLGFWYLPHFLVEPRWPLDGSRFLSHYEYRPVPAGQPIRLPVDDVVHYRVGLDPTNTRKGLSMLKPLLREVFTDDEAATFTSAILGNMGVPGGLIAPSSNDALPTEDDVKFLKAKMQSFRGTQRGEWLVLGQPTEVKQFGFDPNALQLANLRDIAEERVCAALGVPAAVVGFGSGLQQTKVGATMRELRKEAWNSCIRPLQNDSAKQLSHQIIPDFVVQTRRFRVRFDTSTFAASQEEETEKAERVSGLVTAGILRVDRAQAMLGLEVDPDRAIYLGGGGAPKPRAGATEPPAPGDN
ncbi:MAG: phage portal protein [Vicinamibacterales bacterium]